MHSIRRAALAASPRTIASVSKPQIIRSRVLPVTTRQAPCARQPTSYILSSLRNYATESEIAENSPADPTRGPASRTTESLQDAVGAVKDRASEATNTAKDNASEATSGVSDSAASSTDTVKDKLSSVAEKVSDVAQDAAAAVTPNTAPPASSTQSSPIRSESTPGRAQPSKNLYVGNLYFEVTQNQLKQEFSRFGEVKNVKVVYDSRGLSKGFGYIEFATIEQANAAMRELDQQVFEGRRMAVQFALSAGPKVPLANEHGFRHPPSRTLYIGNMSYEMSDTDLNELFKGIKNVTDVRVAIDRRTGQPRGYAHADFLDVDSATKAAEYLKSKQFYGRDLRVDYTHSKVTASQGS